MKAVICLSSLVMLLSISTSSQLFSQDPVRSVPVEIGVYPEDPTEDPRKYVGVPVTVIFEYKDVDQILQYKETHETTLDQLSFLRLHIGLGTADPNNPYEADVLHDLPIGSLCYTITVHDPEGEKTVMGVSYPENNFRSWASVHSEQAQNADALGGNQWTELNWAIIDALNKAEIEGNLFLPLLNNDPLTPGENGFNWLDFAQLFEKNESPSAVTGNPIPYYNIGLGTQCAIIHGAQAVPEIEGFETWCAWNMQEFYNGFVFKIPQAHHPPLSHSTAAVYAENIYDPLGVGLFARGASLGSYNQGQSGMLGLSVGTGNGSASRSRINMAPASGGFKYGALAEDQGFADSWAAAIFGRGFYTGTWSQSSDRRLKTEIRSQADGLNQIMKLRPSQYRYIDNTPYSLPDGIHHGFIAQELEEVLPELVSDITMPVDMNPDKMGTSETTQYKAINYIELIPILTSAVQELKSQLDAQATEIEALKKELKACKPK